MTLKMISSYIFHIRLYNESGLQYLSVEKNCASLLVSLLIK